MTNRDYCKINRMKVQIAILGRVATDYQGKTIEKIIQQMEARVKDMEQ